MKHLFKYHCTDLLTLFDGTDKLSTFTRKLRKQAESADTYDRDKYVGDGFEFFIELLITLLPFHRSLGGLHAYTPIQENDTGADGEGLNWDGERSLIQVKYRSNEGQVLTANKDHLTNLTTVAWREGITPHSEGEAPRIYVITNAAGLHHFTDGEMFEGKVHCINKDTLRVLVDGNKGFWKAALNKVKPCQS